MSVAGDKPLIVSDELSVASDELLIVVDELSHEKSVFWSERVAYKLKRKGLPGCNPTVCLR